MKNVLVVEDEKMIRQGLVTMIARSGVPVERILECANGEQALEVLKQEEIDLMFTDIRMPKMNGITLVKKAQDLPQIPAIVAVSGYDDFSYALEMLRNGVKEYMLKPIEREKIREVLEKMEQLIQEKKKSEQRIQFMEQCQLRYLIENADKEEEQKRLTDIWKTQQFTEGYQVLAVRHGAITQCPESVLCIPDMQGQDMFIMRPESLKEKQELFEELHIGISQVKTELGLVKEACSESLEDRKKAFCFLMTGTQHVKHQIPEQILSEAHRLTEPAEILKRVWLIGTNDEEQLLTGWEPFFSAVKKGWILPQEFEDSMKKAIREIPYIYGDNPGLLLERDRLLEVWEYESCEAYEEAFCDWILDIQAKGSGNRQVLGMARKIREAEEFIKEHYMEDINMAVVSNYLSMNYSLFSHEFKQQTGFNFVSYLKEIRLKHAKDLLEQTDLKIIEISRKVGYEDEKYFMKLFRGTYGVSPGEYRDNIQMCNLRKNG